MDEELLVRHCAPTLAGLKTANLFSCTCENRETLRQHLQRLNRDFVKKGLCALPLRCRNGKALIYVYRPQRLREDLKDREAGEILRRRGYGDQQPGRCLNRLIHRLQDSQDVPAGGCGGLHGAAQAVPLCRTLAGLWRRRKGSGAVPALPPLHPHLLRAVEQGQEHRPADSPQPGSGALELTACEIHISSTKK